MTPAALNRTLAEIRRVIPAVAGLQLGERGQVTGRYYGANISSVFQPWRAPASRNMIDKYVGWNDGVMV